MLAGGEVYINPGPLTGGGGGLVHVCQQSGEQKLHKLSSSCCPRPTVIK